MEAFPVMLDPQPEATGLRGLLQKAYDAVVATKEWLIDYASIDALIWNAAIISPLAKFLRPRGNPKSAWILGRFMAQPLWRRAVHVSDESAMRPLAKISKPVTVRFVVQYHRALRAGEHYDLRLHLKGKAISWAVPSAAVPKPGSPLLAVRQPDHAIEYSDFEGTIPKGEFGAGKVRKVADGIADVFKVEGKKGEQVVHLRVHDTGKFDGDFVLVQTPRRDGKDWLWIRKPENSMEIIGKQTFTLRERRDLARFEDGRHIAEVKVDGHHEVLRIDGNARIVLTSHRISKKTGKVIVHTDKVPHIRDLDARGFEGSIFHGELFIKGEPAAITGGVLNSNVAKARMEQDKRGSIQMKLFDCKEFRGQSVEDLPYWERREIMGEFAKKVGGPHVHVVRGVRSNFAEFYDRVVAGKEFRYKGVPVDGIVIKNLEGKYKEAGSPWIKIKPHDEFDLEIVDVCQEVSKDGVLKDRAGALTVLTPDGKKVQVGTGFKHKEKDWIWANREEIIGDVAMVRFNARPGSPWTGPRFVGFHPGKSEVGALMALELAEGN